MKNSSIQAAVCAAGILLGCFIGTAGHADVQYWSLKLEHNQRILKPTDVVVADINGDGLQDLVVSNGVDNTSKQPLSVFYNTPDQTIDPSKDFSTGNAWYSSIERKYQNVCAADVDDDGCVDVVAAHMLESGGSSLHDLFMNERLANTEPGEKVCAGLSEDRQSEITLSNALINRVKTPAMAFGCDLGDADGDGDVDLAVSMTYCTDPGCAGGQVGHGLSRGLALVFQNSGSGETDEWFDPNDIVIYDAGVQAGDAKLADVTSDGNMDLVVSSMGLRVFGGVPGKMPDNSEARFCWSPKADNYCRHPENSSENSNPATFLSLGLDVAPLAEGSAIGVAMNLLTAYSNSSLGRFRIFKQPCQEDCEIWKSDYSGPGSDALFVRSESDGINFAALRYNKNEQGVENGGAGREDASCDSPSINSYSAMFFWSYESHAMPDYDDVTSLARVAHKNIQGQGVAILPTEQLETAVSSQAYKEVVSPTYSTIPGSLVNVMRVTGDDEQEIDFDYTPGQQWLTLAPSETENVKIEFQYTSDPHLVVADGCGFVHFFQDIEPNLPHSSP